MSEGTKKWELLTDVEYIGSGIPDTALVGFFEFKDDVWLVCSHQEDSSGSELLPPSQSGTQDSVLWDLDDIPF